MSLAALVVIYQHLYALVEVILEVVLYEAGLLVDPIGKVLASELDGVADAFLLYGGPVALLDDIHGLFLAGLLPGGLVLLGFFV